MFHPAQTLAPLAGAKLERLRLSLNSPVVAVESLPVGPAAAGIAVHRLPGGALITIAVRAVRGGQLLYFHPDDTWREGESEELVLEAMLSFAEGMGFLFDDDPIEHGADAAQAAWLWASFLEPGRAREADAATATTPSEADTNTEVATTPSEADTNTEVATAPSEADTNTEVATAPSELDSDAAVTPCEAPVAPDPVLSKFRFLSSIPAERLLSPPPLEEPMHNDSVLRLLSRF